MQKKNLPRNQVRNGKTFSLARALCCISFVCRKKRAAVYFEFDAEICAFCSFFMRHDMNHSFVWRHRTRHLSQQSGFVLISPTHISTFHAICRFKSCFWVPQLNSWIIDSPLSTIKKEEKTFFVCECSWNCQTEPRQNAIKSLTKIRVNHVWAYHGQLCRIRRLMAILPTYYNRRVITKQVNESQEKLTKHRTQHATCKRSAASRKTELKFSLRFVIFRRRQRSQAASLIKASSNACKLAFSLRNGTK